jgi:uroporphyrinogen-III synthase
LPDAPAVLVTRPEPGAAETARRVAALGWRPVLAPALVLTPRPFAAPPAQALLLTSRAAARAVPAMELPVLAVGEATAAEARAHGFVNVAAGGGDAAALADLAAARLDPSAGPLLLAVGEGYGQALAAALRVRGFRVLRRLAYAARPATALPPAAHAALSAGEVVAALFFSPRSARCAISLVRAAGLAATAAQMQALAISPRVAETLREMPAPLAWRAVRVAQRPDQDSLLELLGPR